MTVRPETPAQLDGSIDRLLRERSPLAAVDEGELAATARVLLDSLPRFHPRFSFEEHLARRLAARRHAAGAAPPPTVLRGPDPSPAALLHTDATAAAAPLPALDRRRRGLVAGGAIASGVSLAIPIAGAAIVVWRRSRSQGGLL